MTNTRDRRVLKQASRRSLETARILYEQGRYNHAMYIGGYAIEAALASWLCLKGGKNNLKDTKPYIDGRISGSGIHNLGKLEVLFPEIKRLTSIHIHWRTIVTTWKYNELRYSDKVGDKAKCEKFMMAVEVFHTYIHTRYLRY
jgi:hypothetical protein